MAKKILSILCALAMMVTMVSVAAFSASAAEPVAMGNITSGNWEKWAAAETGAHTTSGYYNIATAGHSIWAMGQTTNVKITSTIGTYNISDAYTLAFDMFYRSENNKVDRTVYTVTVGDLVLTFGDNNHNLPFSATYNGTAVSFDTDTMLNWDHYTSTTQATIKSELLEAGVASNWITAPDSGSATYYANKLIGVEVKLEDGNLTVRSTHKGDTTFTADLTAAGYDKTVDLGETEVKLAVEINKGDTGTLISGLGNFSGTYAAATTGGEGGETPDPEVPDPEVPTTGTFATLSNMTVAKSRYVSGDYFCNLGSGYFYSDYYNSEAMVTSQGRITASSGPYAIGDEFSFSYNVIRDAWPANLTTISDGSQVHGYLNVVTLGDLRIEMSSDNTPFVTVNAYYGDNQIITNAKSGTWSDNNYGVEFGSTSDEWKSNFSFERNEDDTAYVGEVFNKISTAASGGQNTYYAAAKKKAEVTVSYSNGVLTVTYGKIGATTPYTVTANLTNADFSNASLAISVAEVNNRGTMLYDFAGTYTPYVAPAVDPLAPTGAAPTLNSNLTLNVAFGEAGTLAGKGYTDVKVNASIGNLGEEYDLTQKTINGVTYDVAAIDFLTPDLFGEDITIEVTAKDSTGADASYTTTYSVKQYCMNIMDKDYSAELKKLCMAILQFAGKVQALDGTDTITTGLDDYAAYEPTAWTKGTAAWTYTGDQAIKFSGSNLNFANEIGINVYFTADGDASDYKVVSTFGTVSDVVVDPENISLFMATIRISSSMLSEQTAITVKDAATNEVVSETFTLSVEDYANGGSFTADEMECVVALMTYGDAAAAYGATLN